MQSIIEFSRQTKRARRAFEQAKRVFRDARRAEQLARARARVRKRARERRVAITPNFYFQSPEPTRDALASIIYAIDTILPQNNNNVHFILCSSAAYHWRLRDDDYFVCRKNDIERLIREIDKRGIRKIGLDANIFHGAQLRKLLETIVVNRIDNTTRRPSSYQYHVWTHETEVNAKLMTQLLAWSLDVDNVKNVHVVKSNPPPFPY
jgi:hypothetical protein